MTGRENEKTGIYCIRLRPKSLTAVEQMEEFAENLERGKNAARYAALNGYDPEATTIYFTQFLNDFRENERRLGMELGRERLAACQELWCVLEKGENPSSGMREDMERAKELGISIVNLTYERIISWLKEYESKNRSKV